ncbi:MAG TPA: TIGR03067 domain-containing protein [Urbifossiella sp.]|jgi:uncharacterized protein (TIGR03067 family)|nr:TIGR03067 domain-containing protein [Urbifossiella sp.]
MPRAVLVPALFALASVAVVASAQDPATDLKVMTGQWTVVKAEFGGKDATAVFKGVDLRVRPDGSYTVKIGTVTDEGTVALDPAKTPRQMDITGKAGPNAGKTHKTIYKLDGDTLTVCYELGGGDRPAEFKTKAGTQQFLAEYKRAK